MIQLNKTGEKFLSQLMIIGIFAMVAGLVCTYLLYSSTSEIPLLYLPLMVLGSVIGYVMVFHLDPGGTVNYYFAPHKRTTDEKRLYDLVASYRNKMLIRLVTLFYISIGIFFELYKHPAENVFSFDILVGVTVFSFVSELCIGTGIKYISAWWNIKRNMK